MASHSCKIKAHSDTLGGHKPSLGACPENGFFGQPFADHYVETEGWGKNRRVVGSAYGKTNARGLNPMHAGLKGKSFRVPKAKPEGAEFDPAAKHVWAVAEELSRPILVRLIDGTAIQVAG